MAKIGTGYGNIVVIEQDVKRDLGGIDLGDEGIDNTIEGEVVAVGADIKDVKIGYIIVYPRGRGEYCFVDGQQYKILQYLSMLIYKTREDDE